MASTAKRTRVESSGLHGNVKRKLNAGIKVPDAIKKLRGTYHKKNADLAARNVGAESADQLMQALDVPPEFFDPPATLTDEIAIEEWNLFIIPLVKADVIKLTDIRIAEVYCDLWASYQRMKAKTGFAPIKIAEPLIKIMTQMGLTPVSRHKVVRMMREKKAVAPGDWANILNHDDEADDA